MNTPERRRFIRLVGGGTLAAALPFVSACSSTYPDAATAAWRNIPSADNAADPRRWALAHAILAPSSHNRQPWQVDLRDSGAITLYADRERLLPETDPFFRQIMVSQGSFLEVLVLALRERGLAPQVQLFPQGEPGARTLNDAPVARITWAGGGKSDALFAQVRRRHTAKVAYDTTRAVPAAELLALREAAASEAGVRFGGTVQAADLPALRTLCLESARVELSTDRTVMESLRLTRVGPAEIEQHRDGISVNGAFPRVMASLGLFDRSQAPAPGSSSFKAMFDRFREHSETAMGFFWLSTPVEPGARPGNSRRAEVAAGRAYLRAQLAATARGLQVHPMSQAPQEFAEMKPFYDELHRRTVGRPASEEVVQMFCRVGYSAAVGPTPRRPLESFVKT